MKRFNIFIYSFCEEAEGTEREPQAVRRPMQGLDVGMELANREIMT